MNGRRKTQDCATARAKASGARRAVSDPSRNKAARSAAHNTPLSRRVVARRVPQRRGSVIVLVAGILVLLVFVAFSYLSRTKVERAVSDAQQRSNRSDDRALQIRDDIAAEIRDALFPRPFDPTFPFPGDPNNPRWPIQPNAIRYGVDPFDQLENATGNPPADGIPDHPYNYAPYEVVPWTNWPDTLLRNPLDPTSFPRFDDRPGNPGVADTPWLRDTEPHRFLFDYSYPDPQNADSTELFSHWTHLSNLTRAGNGWLLIPDISNIEGSALFFRNTTGYGTPVEQWLPYIEPANYNRVTGRSFLLDAAQGTSFMNAWVDWFSPVGYQRRYATSPPAGPNFADSPPPNFFDLRDINQDGVFHDPFLGERPEDEFNRGALRWFVGRVLTDTDGDGQTDAFWHLAPVSQDGDMRTLVAVSVVDLSSLLNVNTATMSWRGDPNTTGFLRGTAGHAPSDVALFDDLGPNGVGFFRNPQNWETSFPNVGLPGSIKPFEANSPYGVAVVQWNPVMWATFLNELNIQNLDLSDPIARLFYWRTTGLLPFDSEDIFTPFSMADELEQRKFHGQNAPWSMSALERAIQTSAATDAFVRSNLGREESTEYIDQLFNRLIPQNSPNPLYYDELLHDNRRKLTVFNTTRNDLIPPWLRWEARWFLPGIIVDPQQQQFFLELTRRKLDLREELRPHPNISTGTGDRSFAQRLGPALLLALSDLDGPPQPEPQTYYDGFPPPNNNLNETLRLATAYAANILAFRDDDRIDFDGDFILDNVDGFRAAPVFPNPSDPTSVGALPMLFGDGESVDPNNREYFLGMEAQPFLLEAFIAHVYADTGVVPPGFVRAGENYVDATADQTTVVVVQIANPFSRMIDLSNYKLRIFGQDVALSGILGPAREEEPRTAIVFSIEDNFDGNADFKSDWIDFLDIELSGLTADLAAGTLRFDVTLSRDRDDYSDADEPVELFRITPDALDVGTIDVLIDRVDSRNDPDEPHRYQEAVDALRTEVEHRPPAQNVDFSTREGIRIDQDDYLVVWARVARLWGNDFNNIFGLQDDERGPRFIFTSHFDGFDKGSPPDRPTRTLSGGFGDNTNYKGDHYGATQNPDDQTNPWISRNYIDPNNQSRTRKPTFFPCYSVYDAVTGQPIYRMPQPGEIVNLADKGMKASIDYFYDHSLQMLQKNADFEQVGELLNVWLYGHLLDIDNSGTPNDPTDDIYNSTLRTFSEHMSDALRVGKDERVNRLRTIPQTVSIGGGIGTTRVLGRVIGIAPDRFSDPNFLHPNHAVPALPAGVRVLDAFVCDAGGTDVLTDLNGDSLIDLRDLVLRRFRNAAGFSGAGTPGLINISTAPVEVMRALPQMYWLVHQNPVNLEGNGFDLTIPQETRLPEAVVVYRDLMGGDGSGLAGVNDPPIPPYGTRGWPSGSSNPYIPDMRSQRGFASTGEINLLRQQGRSGAIGGRWNDSWRVDFAAMSPIIDTLNNVVDTDLSTDRINRIDFATGNLVRDETAEDVEEANLLYNGISNLITTRSDAFVVYFKVRNVRRDPKTGIWDGTNKELIVDDARYVMIVDRSRVNRPTDQPRILLFEKLPR